MDSGVSKRKHFEIRGIPSFDDYTVVLLCLSRVYVKKILICFASEKSNVAITAIVLRFVVVFWNLLFSHTHLQPIDYAIIDIIRMRALFSNKLLIALHFFLMM